MSSKHFDLDSPRSVTRGKTTYIISKIGDDHLLLTPNNRGVKGEMKVKFKIEKKKFHNQIGHLQ